MIILSLSEKGKRKAASYLGLEIKELFNSFYIALHKSIFSMLPKDGIFNSLTKKTKISASDFSNIVLVWGHPVLNAFAVMIDDTSMNTYRYFKVKKRNIENLKESCGPVFQVNGCSFSLRNEIDKNSPEFNKDLLLKIARATPFPGLKGKVMDFLSEKELIEYLSQYEDYDYVLRQIAISRVKDQDFLFNTVLNKNECYFVKKKAVSNIKNPYFLETIFWNNDESSVIKDAFWQICKLAEQGVIDKDIFIEIVAAKELPINIRCHALLGIDDIEALFDFFDKISTEKIEGLEEYLRPLEDEVRKIKEIISAIKSARNKLKSIRSKLEEENPTLKKVRELDENNHHMFNEVNDLMKQFSDIKS